MLTGRAVDFRVSSQATTHGENIVLRIFSTGKKGSFRSRLGWSRSAAASQEKMIARPEGIILLTGPTGSGQDDDALFGAHHINNDGLTS